MSKKTPLEQITLGAIALLVCASSLLGQEPPPPQPPPPGMPARDVFIFNRMEYAFAQRNVQGAPYSAQAITNMTQTLSDGNQIHRSHTTAFYRDSEGRTRVEETLGGFGPWAADKNHPQQIIRINDPVAGVSYVLNPETHVAEQIPERGERRRELRGRLNRRMERREMRFGQRTPPPPGEADGAPPQGEVQPGVNPPPPPDGPEEGGVAQSGAPGGGKVTEWRPADEGDVKTESLGSQVLEGVQAEGTRRTVTIPAGRIGNEKPIEIVTERWYSNQLQAVVLSKRSDPRVGETVYQLTNISQAEPAASLFQVPEGYKLQQGPRFRLQPPNQGPPQQ